MKRLSALTVIFAMLASLCMSLPVMAEDISIEFGKTVTNQLLDQTEVDIYRFTVTEPGSIIPVFEYPSEDLNYTWQIMLYSGSTCLVNTRNINTSVVAGEMRTWELDPFRLWPGEYYFLIKNANARNYTNKDYKFTVNFNAESLEEYEKELNNAWSTAYAIPFNAEVKGNISYAKDWDFAKISLPYDGSIQVNFKYPEDYEGSGWKVYFYSVPKGLSLIEAIDAEKVGKPKDGYYEINFKKIRVSKGNYCVAVCAYDTTDLSDEGYILTANVVDETNIPHEKERNDSFDKAYGLEFNTKTLGNLETAEDMDYAKFTLSEAGDIKLYMYYPTGEQQQTWEMVLYNEKKERLGFTYNNNAGEKENGMHVMTLSKQGLEAGTYYVSVMTPVGGTYSYGDYYLMAENKNAPIPAPEPETVPTEPEEEEIFVDEQLIKTGVPTILDVESLPEIDDDAIENSKTLEEAAAVLTKYVASLTDEQKTSFLAAEKIQTAAEYAFTCLTKTDAEKIINKDTLSGAMSAVSDIAVPQGVNFVREKELNVAVTVKSNEAVIKADCAEAGVDNVFVKFNGASLKVPVKALENDVTVGLINKGDSFDVAVLGSEDVKILIPSENATAVVYTEAGNTVYYPALETEGKILEAPAASSGNYYPERIYAEFSDISGLSPEMQNAICDMARRGIINGVEEGKFDPSGLLTRAQTVKLIVAALGLTDLSATEEFSDVSEKDWHYSYVATGAKYGFVNGYPDGTFAPDATIAKQELVKVFAEVMKNYGGYKYPDNVNLYLDFSDSDTLGDWAKPYMAFMSYSKILPVRADGKLAPAEAITRAEAALMLYRMFELL